MLSQRQVINQVFWQVSGASYCGHFSLISPCRHGLVWIRFSANWRHVFGCFPDVCKFARESTQTSLAACGITSEANKKINSEQSLRRTDEPERKREGVRKMFEWKKGVFFWCRKPLSRRFIHQMCLVGRVYDVGTSSSRTQENVRYAPRSKPLKGQLAARAERNARSLVKVSLYN